MDRDSFMQFTQELNPESQPSEREQIGFLGIQGKTFPIYDGPNKIGRDPGSCSIALDNGTLSRLHAVINIVTTNGQRTINLMDIGSRNKTKVGLRVLQNFVPYPLTDGDTVQFGEVHGVFRVLQPRCDFPMTQDFAMTQEMPCTQEVPDSPLVNCVKNNLRSNIIVPESPDVSDKDDSLIFKSPMLMSKNKPNLKSIQAKKLSDVAMSNNFLNNTTKSMICDETNSKTVVRFSNESNNSCDRDKTIVNEVLKERIDVSAEESFKIDSISNKTIENVSNQSIDSIYQANTQLPNANSPSIHSLDTQIPLEANKSNDIDIETEKKEFEDSLFNENDDIHIASTQIILKDTFKKFNSGNSNINEADTQLFNNSDSNISDLQTQVFACEDKVIEESNLDTQVFGANDVSSANTQIFGEKDLCDAETQMFPENKTIETATVIKQEKLVINNADTQFDSRDDEDFCNLNTQVLAEDLAPTNIKKEVDTPKKSQEAAIRKPALIDSPDIIDDDDGKDDFNDLNTQVLEINEQLTPDFVVPETSKTTVEKPIENSLKANTDVESKSDQDKELLESDDEISFEALKENEDEQYDISLSQNILGDSETILEHSPTVSKPPTIKDKTFKSPKPVTPRKNNTDTKTQENPVDIAVTDVDIADMCTQIVKPTPKSPAAFEEDEVLTQCDISFEDMPTQVLTYEKSLEDSKRRVAELQSISVASLSKKSSGNTSGELENSLSFLSPRKFIAMELPDSQEIELNINHSSDVEDNMLTDSEQEPNTLENTPILFRNKPKQIKKEKKNDVKKSLDFTNVEVPVRVMTRIRKPTARLIDADPESKKAVENILKPKVSDEVDTDILSENITRLKTKNGNDSTTAEVIKTLEKDVKPKKEAVKRESKRGSAKNEKDIIQVKIEKTVKKDTAKKVDSKSKRNSSEKTSKGDPKEEIKTSRYSKRRSDEAKQEQTKDTKPDTSKKSTETKPNSNNNQNTKEILNRQKTDSQITKETSDDRNSKEKSNNRNTKQKTDDQNKKQKSDSHNTKQTDKSKDTKSKKRRTNSVSSDETEPIRKRTRLEQKKEGDSNKIHEQKRSDSKSKAKKSDENKIDITIDVKSKSNTKSAKNTDIERKSDRTTRKTKDSVITATDQNKNKPDSIDLTALDTKNSTETTKIKGTETKIKGILKNVNQIDKYFVKEDSPQNRIELRKRQMETTEVDVKKRRLDSQRTSKTENDVKSYKVLFTAFHNDEVKKKLVELGAVLVTEIKECDVLVTVQIKRTFKLLCAVGLGKPIVGPQWVQKCVDTGCFVDPWQYVIQDDITESKYKFNLKSTLRGRRNFLRGYKVSSTPSVNPKEDEMKQIVECSGGKWGTGRRKWLCVTCMLDKHAWPGLETKGATLLHVEFILHGALTQNFDVDSYKLTA